MLFVWLSGFRLLYPARVVYISDAADYAFLQIGGAFDAYVSVPDTAATCRK